MKINLKIYCELLVYYCELTYICVTKADSMNTAEIRKEVAKYMEVGFTMSEAFFNIKDSLRERRKRSGHKLAEVVGTKAQREGLEDGYNAKKYLH